MAVYRKGSTETIFVAFSKEGVPYTPDHVTLTVYPPDSTSFTLDETSPLLLHQAGTPNEWYYDLELADRGTYHITWLGTGTYVDSNGDNRPYRQPFFQVLRVYIAGYDTPGGQIPA